MKILCICQQGNSRSVGLAFLLKNMGHDAVAIGIHSARRSTRRMLCKWADKIILVVPKYEHWIKPEFKHKLLLWDVGRDIYFAGWKNDLLEKYQQFMKDDPQWME